MTTPTERLRSLRWGWNLLAVLEHDLELDAVLSERAQLLASSYPRPEILLAARELKGPGLPADFAAIVDGSRHLFTLISVAESASHTLRMHATRVLRHFPSHAVCVDMIEAAGSGSLHKWLAADHC